MTRRSVDRIADARVTNVRANGASYVVLSIPSPREVTLTPAERQIRDALLRGCSHREIAAARGTSIRTVANQVARVFRKLGVTSRAELAALALLDDV